MIFNYNSIILGVPRANSAFRRIARKYNLELRWADEKACCDAPIVLQQPQHRGILKGELNLEIVSY